MEVAVADSNSLRIKGKHASVGVNPKDKSASINAAIILGSPTGIKIPDGVVSIQGPGEYEVNGIKISGLQSENDTVYTAVVDDIIILVGLVQSLAKVQTKLQDAHIVLAYVTEDIVDASFITGFTPNAVLFYGEKAQSAISTFEKEGVVKQSKFVTTLEKLPQEMVTVLLQ